MNGITMTGFILLIITLTIHFIFLNRNKAFKKEHPATKSPLVPYVIVTGLINFVGLAIMVFGIFH